MHKDPCRSVPKPSWLLGGLLALSLSSATSAEETPSDDWVNRLGERIDALEREADGELGVHVRRLRDDSSFDHQGDRLWYLSSTVKIPVAVVVLQQVERGDLSLEDELTLEPSQRIDGAGDLLWQDPGARYSIDNLLERMLIDSDNIAADMLIGTIGIDTLNDRIQAMTQDGFFGDSPFEPFTTLAEVRYAVYGEIHPSARDLDREQLIEIAAAPIGPERVDALARTLNLSHDELQIDDMDTAYQRYYAKQLNSATLAGYSDLLASLVRGELLDDEHRELLYRDLKIDSYDAYRLEGGLPRSVDFIQKTGTQHRRACHMGVIRPDQPDEAIVVTACTAEMDEAGPSERLLERVGEAIDEILLSDEESA